MQRLHIYQNQIDYQILRTHFSLVTPLPIVVTAVASRYQQYGVRDESGNFLLYVTLSLDLVA